MTDSLFCGDTEHAKYPSHQPSNRGNNPERFIHRLMLALSLPMTSESDIAGDRFMRIWTWSGIELIRIRRQPVLLRKSHIILCNCSLFSGLSVEWRQCVPNTTWIRFNVLLIGMLLIVYTLARSPGSIRGEWSPRPPLSLRTGIYTPSSLRLSVRCTDVTAYHHRACGSPSDAPT